MVMGAGSSLDDSLLDIYAEATRTSAVKPPLFKDLHDLLAARLPETALPLRAVPSSPSHSSSSSSHRGSISSSFAANPGTSAAAARGGGSKPPSLSKAAAVPAKDGAHRGTPKRSAAVPAAAAQGSSLIAAASAGGSAGSGTRSTRNAGLDSAEGSSCDLDGKERTPSTPSTGPQRPPSANGRRHRKLPLWWGFQELSEVI
eukprot:NODE_4604_length_784_cov_20.178231_g3824_i0.p2 GENE.NODE_4604_length_784_cov_20.178231_g3824_i0~~NODE_4604_length_784_cov_20.178231_g3824_i0.p2  ORF type:complete len:201 (+),score=5.38 NODE_4604_length_784_cov_20.178231_g3824_i0:2-604(+)